jgi:hypothetical protein
MATILNSTTCKAYADVAEYLLLEIDTSNTSYPDVYAKIASARTVGCFGVSTADAESDEKETIKYEPLLPGHIYPVMAGEVLAVGNIVTPMAAGLGAVFGTTNDKAVGTCVGAAAIGYVAYFMVDSNFGRVSA